MEQRFGWVEWKGGDRPVPGDTIVKVLIRSELAEDNYADYYGPARDVAWDHVDDEDVIAYKILRDAAGNLVNADVPENPVHLFRAKPATASYGAPLPTIALGSMAPPLSGEDLVAGAPQVNTSPIPVVAVGEGLMLGGFPYDELLAGDTHEMVTFGPMDPYVIHVTAPSNVIKLPVREMPPGAVGDIASDAKGSGARFNSGKIPVELIPLTMIGEFFLDHVDGLTPAQENTAVALIHLGEYQSRTRGVDALYDALAALGDPVEVLRECAQVFDYGRKKYAAFNWAKGMAWSIPFGCAGRHALFGVLEGEHLDQESGKPHRGHMACNITMLIAYAECYPEGDDRPAEGMIGAAPQRFADVYEALRA